MSSPFTIEKNAEANSVKLGDVYFRFAPDHNRILVGEWNENVIESLNLSDMIKLRNFLDRKIMTVKVNKIKELKAPF